MTKLLASQLNQPSATLLLVRGRRRPVRRRPSDLRALSPRRDFVPRYRSWLINPRYLQEVQLTTGRGRLPDPVQAPLSWTCRAQLLRNLVAG